MARAQPLTCAHAVPWRMELSRGSESSAHALAVARLLAEAFGEGEEDELRQPSLLAYQLRLATATQWQAVRQGARFATALAFDSAGGGLVGVCQVAQGLTVPGAGGHQLSGSGRGSSAGAAAGGLATISNMAVSRRARCQGLGAQLLRRCEAAALDANPALAALAMAAYQDNHPALR